MIDDGSWSIRGFPLPEDSATQSSGEDSTDLEFANHRGCCDERFRSRCIWGMGQLDPRGRETDERLRSKSLV